MNDARTTETIEAEGHLIDSQLLQHIFDKVIEHGATYEVLEFRIGTTNDGVDKVVAIYEVSKLQDANLLSHGHSICRRVLATVRQTPGNLWVFSSATAQSR